MTYNPRARHGTHPTHNITSRAHLEDRRDRIQETTEHAFSVERRAVVLGMPCREYSAPPREALDSTPRAPYGREG